MLKKIVSNLRENLSFNKKGMNFCRKLFSMSSYVSHFDH